MNRARVGETRHLEERVLFPRGPRREQALRQGSGFMPGIASNVFSFAGANLTLWKVGLPMASTQVQRGDMSCPRPLS